MAFKLTPWFLVPVILLLNIQLIKAEYGIGVGRADVTGPAAGVVFMGYAQVGQKGRGIHLRQYARAFIVEDGDDRICFVSVDSAMMGHALREKVLKNLYKRYGGLYNENNLVISATHTHGAPGGFMMHFLYDISTYGFIKESFNGLAAGITRSIVRAHESMVPGRIFVTSGEIIDANINRSPTAYLNNPEEERAKYRYDTDKDIVQLKFYSAEDSSRARLLGALNWYAVHGTSMNYTNRLISSDNIGYASILLENKMNNGSLSGRGKFVGAFASTNLGDVSPNTRGPRCLKTGNVCDILSSKCKGPGDLCASSGPGVDIFDSTKIIATKLYTKAFELLNNELSREITGPLRSVHQFIDMTTAKINTTDPITKEEIEVKGCLPAMGYSFMAGTTDGPGPLFEQGATTNNEVWNYIRDKIAPPTKEDIDCHQPKPIGLATGQMNYPLEWQPRVVSTQLLLIGDFAIAAVPGEFTTMAGRRMRDILKHTLEELGAPQTTQVVIGGLSNVYSSYITTPEEYQIQRYEGASTIYGPHTLSIYIQQYKKLANTLMKGEELTRGPSPPDLSKNLVTFLPPVIVDIAPWRKDFGECIQQPQKIAKPGDTVSAVFVAGHPRNSLMQEKTFLRIERHDGDDKWTLVATDADWETKFLWRRKNVLMGTSEAEIQWEIGHEVTPGEYRIIHIGNRKKAGGTIIPYEGVTQTFQVTDVQ